MIKHNMAVTADLFGHWFIVSQGKIWLSCADAAPPLCRYDQLPEFLDGTESLCLIGSIDGVNCYLLNYSDRPEAEDQWHSARALLLQSAAIFEHAARACQVALFLQTHRYCGQCGSSMHLVNWELAALCHKCGHRCYPRIAPCVLVGIVKDRQILLARSSRHRQGFYSILAGFVESGETLEQAAVREVAEEVGVRIGNLRYAGSQPWPFPHSLMVGFYADYQSGDIVCQEDEIAEAHWFDLGFDSFCLLVFSLIALTIATARFKKRLD